MHFETLILKKWSTALCTPMHFYNVNAVSRFKLQIGLYLNSEQEWIKTNGYPIFSTIKNHNAKY